MAVVIDYSTLSQSVADWLARSDLTSFVPNFIQNFEERFYRDPENWKFWMESNLSATVTSGLAPVPADYLGLRIAYVVGQNGPALKRLSLEQLYERYPRTSSAGGQASYISRTGTNFVFGRIPSDGTVINGTYFAKPALLRNALTNWLTINAPDLLTYGALLEAEAFLKNDGRVALWTSAYNMALDTYQRMGKNEDESGSAPFAVAS